jgi:glycosyltransferase involved in cell wall biosynthesis
MAFGSCVVVNGTPENRETIGEAGLAYDGRVGAPALEEVLADLIRRPALADELGRQARSFAAERYSWEEVANEYERLFYSLRRAPAPDRLTAPKRD